MAARVLELPGRVLINWDATSLFGVLSYKTSPPVDPLYYQQIGLVPVLHPHFPYGYTPTPYVPW